MSEIPSSIGAGEQEFNSLKPTERRLSREPLAIEVPTLNELPRQPLDAVIVLGMGPVLPSFRGEGEARRVVTDLDRMRHNAHATVEISTRGIVKDDGLIIASGRNTANPEVVKNAFLERNNALLDNDLELRSRPLSLDEVEIVLQTTEASLMADIISNVSAKPDASFRKNTIEIFKEHVAKNTIGNFAYSFNELDRRSREKTGKLFDGSVALIAGEDGHMVRSFDVARLLGLDQKMVPLTSQEVLREYEYTGKLYQGENEENVPTRFSNEQWLLRAMREIPEFVLTEVVSFKDDERFRQVLQHLESVYGSESFARNGIATYMTEESSLVRGALYDMTRLHPHKEDWYKTDTVEITNAVTAHKDLTKRWLHQPRPE